MIAHHKGELQERQKAMLKARADRAESWKRKGGKTTIDVEGDPKDLRAVAVTFVCEMMEVYADKVIIPRTTGRGRWFPIAQVGRLITGFFLNQVNLEEQQWDDSHRQWLKLCETEFLQWTAELPGFTSAPPALEEGYAAAVKSTRRASSTSRDSSQSQSTRTKKPDPQVGRSLQPPSVSIPERNPIMEMLQKQFASPASLTPPVSTVSPKVSSGATGSAARASATATSSSEYPGEAVEIAKAVQAAVEAKTGAGVGEKPTEKGSSSSPASSKRRRLDSRSPPASKRFSKGGAQSLTAQLRRSEAEWQDRAARAEEDLKKVRADYRTLDKEFRAAKTKWETDRTRLAADKSTAEAEAAENKVAADEAVKASREASRELTQVQKKLDQVTKDYETLRARDRDWESEKTAMLAHITTLTDEVEKWRRDACYRLPNGRLQLVHIPSYTEILWGSRGSVESRDAATEEEREAGWKAVVEAFKIQLRDLRGAWTYVEGEHKKNPQMDVYSALYGSTRVAVQQISAELVRQVGDKVAGRREGKTLAEDLTGLQARSQAEVKVHELDTSTAQNAEVVALREQLAATRAELQEAKNLVDTKTRDCSTMHTYGSRHADCLRSISGSLQTVANGLVDLLQQRADSAVPSEVRESRALEESVEHLQEVLSSVEQRSEPISMRRRQLPALPATGAPLPAPLLTAASLSATRSSPASTAAAAIVVAPQGFDIDFGLGQPQVDAFRVGEQQQTTQRRSPRVAKSTVTKSDHRPP